MKNILLSILLFLTISITVRATDSDLAGKWTCTINQTSSTISLNSNGDGKIYNYAMQQTDSIFVYLLFSTSPYSGGNLIGYKNKVFTSAYIPALTTLENKSATISITDLPPSGTYYISLIVLEKYNQSLIINDFENFKNTITFSTQNNSTFTEVLEAADKPFDGNIIINQVYWQSMVDADDNGYFSYGELMIDANYSYQSPKVVYTKFYYKTSTSSNYILSDTSDFFTLYGSDPFDNIIFPIHSLAKNSYDFKVEYYDTRGNLVYVFDATINPNLNDMQLESQETTDLSVNFYSIYWESKVDHDDDGYFSSKHLVFNCNITTDNTLAIYVKVYYAPSGTYTYTLDTVTDIFIIEYNYTSDTYKIPIFGIPYGSYDFKLEAYTASNQLLSTVTYDSDLINQKFEIADEIGNLSAYVSSNTQFQDLTDTDYDSYTSSRTLHLDIDNGLNESVEIYAKIFYKLSNSTDFVLYKTTEKFTISSTSTIDAKDIKIEGLDYGIYDFKFEIYSNQNALINSYFHSNFKNKYFELTDQIPPYYLEVFSANWSFIVDNDEDNYSASRELDIDLDIYSGAISASVYVKLYYKTANSSTYTLKSTTPAFTLNGDSGDDYVTIPVTNLPQDIYDFKFEVYSANNQLLLTYSDVDTEHFNEQQFEATETLPSTIIKVYNASWTNSVDLDHDGYTLSRTLKIDIDIVSGATSENIYIKLFSKTASSIYFSLLKTTPVFSITGSTSLDYTTIEISNLPFGIYDFKIEVFTSDNEQLLTYGDDDNSALDYEFFEQTEGSSTLSVGVNTLIWTNIVDEDEDGYALSKDLNIDFNILNGETSAVIFYKMYLKKSYNSYYSLVYTSPNFTITGTQASDYRVLSFSELSYSTYDLKIEIFSSNYTLLSSISNLNRSELNAVKFENPETYSSPIYISEADWLEINDNDMDDYSSSRILRVKVNNATDLNKNVYLKVYYKVSSSDTYTLLRNTLDFNVLEYPNFFIKVIPINGLDHDIYDFMIEIYDYNRTLLSSYTKNDDKDLANQKFEQDYQTSVDELSFKWNIYPNPASEYITIETNNSEGTVRISDATGKIVHESSFNESKFNLSVEGLLGIYKVTISTNDSYSTKSLIVK